MMDLVAFEAGAKKNCPIYEFLGLSVLEAEKSVLEAEKSWLESQVKAWMQTAQKYYYKIKNNG